MWFIIIGLMLTVFLFGLVYLSFRAAHFRAVRKIAGSRRWLARLLCFCALSAFIAFLWLIWNMMNALVCMLHLMLFWALCDTVAIIISKVRGKKPECCLAGAAAIILCALWLTWGWISAHNVRMTAYTFETDKLDSDYRIVQISDSHIGATFDADGFLSYIEKIYALEPDLVVITGDFVDDDTTRLNMLASCDALGKLKTPDGVLFVFGNHDNGYFGAEKRGWTSAELRSALEQNGVVILEDALYPINGRLCAAGRKDKSRAQRGGRLSTEQLLSGTERDQYVVVLDHQPNDFDAEAAAGADLVLCGHTHGGQFIPINHVGEWIGENDLRYGHEKRGGTDFVVSSGISNWTFKFKTGCFSEYVVIDIVAKP